MLVGIYKQMLNILSPSVFQSGAFVSHHHWICHNLMFCINQVSACQSYLCQARHRLTYDEERPLFSVLLLCFLHGHHNSLLVFLQKCITLFHNTIQIILQLPNNSRIDANVSISTSTSCVCFLHLQGFC